MECDLLDRAGVKFVIDEHRPRACIHCAWDVARDDYLHSAENQRWTAASLHLAQSLKQAGCSWLGVCGTHLEPVDRCPPCNRYAAAKSTLRHRLFDLASAPPSPGMRICWWRIFQPYGPGERASRFIPSMLDALSRGRRFLVRQPQAQRDFIHARDVAAAIATSLENQSSGVFDVGSGHVQPLRDVAMLAARICDRPDLMDFAALDEGSNRDGHLAACADIAALQSSTGWRPRVSLEAGLRDLAQQHTSFLRATA
jgi:nucleoside-diphosphate-sugar epimerase